MSITKLKQPTTVTVKFPAGNGVNPPISYYLNVEWINMLPGLVQLFYQKDNEWQSTTTSADWLITQPSADPGIALNLLEEENNERITVPSILPVRS